MKKANTKSIVVVESGFVFLAECKKQDDEYYHLTDCAQIRKYGTTAGLGQLALHGPQKETVLDPCGEAFVPTGKVLFILPCTY